MESTRASRIAVRLAFLITALCILAPPALSDAQPKLRDAPVAKGTVADIGGKVLFHETFETRIRTKWKTSTPAFCFRQTDPVSAEWRRPSDSCPATAGGYFRVQRWTSGSGASPTLEVREISSNLCLGLSPSFDHFPYPVPADRIPAVGMDCGEARRLAQIDVPGRPGWFYLVLDLPAPPPQPGPGKPLRLCLHPGTNLLDGFGSAKHFLRLGPPGAPGSSDLSQCQAFQFY